MIALDPVPSVRCGMLEFFATEADRPEAGLVATGQVARGDDIVAARPVRLGDPADRAAFTGEIRGAIADLNGADLEAALLKLLPAVEAALRRAPGRGLSSPTSLS